MGIFLLAAFIGVPLIEIAVFVEVGAALGLWPTLGLVVLTAVLGTWQLRAQGLATLLSARNQVERGALPTRELFDGAGLLVAGALLLTPGFVTDGVGFFLFLRPVRDILLGLLARHVHARGQARVFVDGEKVSPDGPDGPIIDGDYRDVTERAEPSGTGRRLGPGEDGRPERGKKLPE